MGQKSQIWLLQTDYPKAREAEAGFPRTPEMVAILGAAGLSPRGLPNDLSAPFFLRTLLGVPA